MMQRTIPAASSILILEYLRRAKQAAAYSPAPAVNGLNDIQWNIEMAEKFFIGYLIHDVSVEIIQANKPKDAP